MVTQVPTITLTNAGLVDDTITLRPDGIGALTELSPIGFANNWECVKDVISDDDTSFVFTDNVSIVSDLYTIPVGSHIGSVVNVKVHTTAKSHLNAQSGSGIYKILISDNVGVNIYESDDKDLTTSYLDYSYVWGINPRTGLAWIWADIDTLQIGVECSSPSITPDNLEYTSRPTGNDVVTLIPHHHRYGAYGSDPTNYECVDNAIYSQYLYVYLGSVLAWKEDTYNIELLPHVGSVAQVTVFYRARRSVSGGTSYAKPCVKTGGFTHYGNTTSFSSTTWRLISYTWILNPQTGLSWTWADVDNLKIGISFYTQAFSMRCSQMYAIVEYTPPVYSPEIRTTQEYVEITRTATITCKLPKPVDILVNQDIDTNALNFWSGNREVYALGRSSKRTMLSGIMWDGCTDGTSTCEDIIHCVRALGKAKTAITISDLRYVDLNVNYNILSFSWKQQDECSNTYDWQLELEFCD